jgi:hypothetical protein
MENDQARMRRQRPWDARQPRHYWIGVMGDTTYYVVDGKVWADDGQNVKRCDDPDENERLLKRVRKANAPYAAFDHLRITGQFRFVPNGNIYTKTGDGEYSDQKGHKYVGREANVIAI